jgi:hypothetical protein
MPRTRGELERDEDTLDRYRLFGSVSGVSFAMGIAAAGTGGALLLFGGSSEGPDRVAVEGGFIAPGAFGLHARKRF